MKKKKDKEKKPLERHKLLLKKLSENISKGMSMEKAMKAAGYSPSYAKSSTHLKDTRSWDVLMKEVLNDDLLTEKHKKLLEKKEIFNIDGELVKSGQVHSDVRHALDMAYKLKNKYAPEEYNLKFKGFSKEQLIDRLLSKIVKKK